MNVQTDVAPHEIRDSRAVNTAPSKRTPSRSGGLIDMVKRANRPGPAEHSIPLRIAAAGAVISGIWACYAVRELAVGAALVCSALIVIGSAFSHLTRSRPYGAVKPFLAFAVLAVFTWFIFRIKAGGLTDIGSVEAPLSLLFAMIQVTHAFDVPARRDLTFSFGGSASLVAVAAAQAVTPSFGLIVVSWAGFGIWGLFLMAGSATGGPVKPKMIVGSLIAVAVLVFTALVVLPAPHVAGTINFPHQATRADKPVANPKSLTGDSGSTTTPSQSPAPTEGKVGGFLGFSTRLDTATRASLGNQIVMRVRASQPSFWVGEVFDDWDGQSWTEPTRDRDLQAISPGPPFSVPAPSDQLATGTPDVQTFYIAANGPNLIFHAENASTVWFPADSIFSSTDSTLVSPIGMGSGTTYTVQSLTDNPTADELRAADSNMAVLPTATQTQMTELPKDQDPRVSQLAQQVTAGLPDTYDKVEALISWIGANTKYSTDIPVPPKGEDAVTAFLFGNRTGYCEQISTSLAMLLRSSGIPAREVVGYVPGPYDPLTDLYEVQAKDAHAWVQVWFSGYGWQSFDPTAVVPLANPTPGQALLTDTGHFLRRLPWLPTGLVVVVVALMSVVVRWRIRRPRTWGGRMVARLVHRAQRQGAQPKPDWTITEIAEHALGAAPKRRRPIPVGGVNPVDPNPAGSANRAAPRHNGVFGVGRIARHLPGVALVSEAEMAAVTAILNDLSYGGKEPTPSQRHTVEEVLPGPWWLPEWADR